MVLAMQCPFYKKTEGLNLNCEGGVIKFPDTKAKFDYTVEFCGNSIQWKKCTICKNLESYYERKDS